MTTTTTDRHLDVRAIFPPGKHCWKVASEDDRALIEAVYRFRYDVYCLEYGFASRNADHERRTITDELDATAIQIVVTDGGVVLGCARVNLSAHSSLGEFEQLLGMHDAPGHPHATALATKLMVRASHRHQGVDRLVIDRMATILCRSGVDKVFMDCRPELVGYYQRIGCRKHGAGFRHHETGWVVPMAIDLRDIAHLRAVRSPLCENAAVMALTGVKAAA